MAAALRGRGAPIVTGRQSPAPSGRPPTAGGPPAGRRPAEDRAARTGHEPAVAWFGFLPVHRRHTSADRLTQVSSIMPAETSRDADAVEGVRP